MREHLNAPKPETEAAFAFAALLMNLLILLVLLGSVWMLYALATQSDLLGMFLRDYAFYK